MASFRSEGSDLKTRLQKEDAPAASKVMGAVDEVTQEITIREAKLSVVIPAFNEAATIADIVKGAVKYADEVIVVDDGSSDNTSFVAKAAGAKVIRLPTNSGKGFALSMGLSTAALDGADLIVCLDGDGQHNPEEIPMICGPVLRGEADLVIGSRFLVKKGSKEIPSYRKVGQHVLTKATNFGNGVKVTDSQSGFRCLTKKAALSMELTEAGMGIESEMVRDAVKLGLKIKEIPISCKYEGLDTSTLEPGAHGTSVLSSIIRVVRDEHPLLYFGVGGLVVTIAGIIAGLYSIYEFMAFKSLPFIPSLAAVLLFFLGIMSMFVGIILNSLATRRDR